MLAVNSGHESLVSRARRAVRLVRYQNRPAAVQLQEIAEATRQKNMNHRSKLGHVAFLRAVGHQALLGKRHKKLMRQRASCHMDAYQLEPKWLRMESKP